MAKDIKYGKDSRQKMLEGVNKLADAVKVDDYDADGQAYLWCCESYAFSLTEGFKHVVDEFLQVGIICRNVFSYLAKHRLAKYVHWKYHGDEMFFVGFVMEDLAV